MTFLDLCTILPNTRIKKLVMNKNLLGDESLISIVDCMQNYPNGHCIIEYIDISSCRIGDDGILYFLESLDESSSIQ